MILTKKYVKILGIVACIAVAGVGVNFAVLPVVNDSSSAKEEIVEVQDNVDTLDTRRTALTTSKKQYPELKLVNESLVTQFPETGETQELMEQVVASANSVGIASNAIQSTKFEAPIITLPEVAAPAPKADAEKSEDTAAEKKPAVTKEVSTDGYGSMIMTISVNGNKEQLVALMNSLNGMERAILIEKFNITYSDSKAIYTLSIGSKVFLYAPIVDPDTTAAVPAGEAESGDENSENAE